MRYADFTFAPFDWGRVAEPVGPATGAGKVTLNVVEVAPEQVWRLGWSPEEENIAVIFAGGGHADVTAHRERVARGDAVHSPTGHTLELEAGTEGMTAYVWRTKLVGGEPRGEAPRLTGRLSDDETQLRGFTGSFGEDRTGGAVMNFVFWPGTGSARLCLHCGMQEPGQTFNVHQHPESEEAFIAFEGDGQLYLIDRWHEVSAGDVLFAAPGVPHGARNPKTDPAAGRFVTCGGPTPFDPALYASAGVTAEVR
ncbi:cupin domain-containing protein [Amycolatopsis anabasis]|uniref:cupin domain-containing protein n=1 Tax=Amycolatopsis anabasis TaxID=1840409 RepID=UPI001C552328|nr:cupin domain-containing protein [Amycolatopsis anabasis]